MVERDEGVEELLAASRGLLGVVARSLSVALESVTVPQFRLVVLAAAHGPVRSGDLAARLDVSISTLSRNVDRLVAKGYVDRRTNEDNRRESLVTATASGHALIAGVTERRRAELEALLGEMPASERRKVVLGAHALRTAFDDPSVDQLAAFGG